MQKEEAAQGGSPDAGAHTIRVSYPNQTLLEDPKGEQNQEQDTGTQGQIPDPDGEIQGQVQDPSAGAEGLD